ncbi:MAG: hypothetical protein IT202_03245 [Fimbriimonadaceae bacterium]|nr:hypothetical protein [Fimbriimonadaceae bacterium]
MATDVEILVKLDETPKDQAAFGQSLDMKWMVKFLEANDTSSEFVLYAGLNDVFLHSILVPNSLLSPPDEEDVMSWSANPFDLWTYSEGGNPTRRVLCPPLHSCRSRTLEQGEQFVFGRTFDGALGSRTYYELSQPFAQISDLHFQPERKAYCSLDEQGDVANLVTISEHKLSSRRAPGHAVVANRACLDEYLRVRDSSIVRLFDVVRVNEAFFGWNDSPRARHGAGTSIVYDLHLEAGKASYARGFQVVRRREARPEAKEFASFIANDWKNKVVREISCAPGKTSNYFTKSDLPFELSPAFFRPEVLSKYKADKEKYRMTDRSISCRGAWALETYDINPAGQVHTYLVYLRNLPYQEQLHWKSYNEAPKGTISARAYASDFKGEWHEEYDPLPSLKDVLAELQAESCPWWRSKGEALFERSHYPITESPDEWADELMALDQLLVEGLEVKWLRNKATELKRKVDVKLGSIKLIEECLIGIGFEEPSAREAVHPIAEVHGLRSKLKGHAHGAEAVEIRRAALAKHGSLRAHFRDLVGKCNEAVRLIRKNLR